MKLHTTTLSQRDLCIYVKQQLPQEQLEDISCSHMHLMHVPSKNLSFNVEKAKGNNLGHYVDQPCSILESLHQIKELFMPPLPQPEEIDWLTVEKEIDERCNAEYKVVGKQLVIVAKHDLHKAKHPEEIDEGSYF